MSSGLILFFLSLLIDITEYVVENEVASGLFGEDEGLDKLLQLCRLVGGFADDLDDNVIEGALRIDIGDSNFTVLKVELLDSLLDSLQLLDAVR